jgi:hypothetical protein
VDQHCHPHRRSIYEQEQRHHATWPSAWRLSPWTRMPG